jgi:hypothetical protein
MNDGGKKLIDVKTDLTCCLGSLMEKYNFDIYLFTYLFIYLLVECPSYGKLSW